MALAADASVGEMALFAKEWLSQSSASPQHQEQLPVPSMKKSFRKSGGRLMSPERAKEGNRCSGRKSRHEGSVGPEKVTEGLPSSGENSARGSCVQPKLQALDLPTEDSTEKGEAGIPPLTSTFSPVIKSRCARSSSNLGKRADRVLPNTSSPTAKSNDLRSSRNRDKKEDEIPTLTSTCSPLIKSKSSKSSSSQGCLPGLVVAPDGVTLVKDRRKCKPRGILTVGHEMSTSSEGNDGDEEVAMPMPSPSVATVEWVDESWNDMLSSQCQTDELRRDASVNSTGVFGPRTVLTFDLPLDNKNELGGKESSPNRREAIEFRPKIIPSVQESYEVGESVEGSPGDLIVADRDVSFVPELGYELPHSGRDYSVSTSPSKHQHHLGSIQVISPQKQVVFSDFDQHRSFQVERRADDSGSPGLNVSEGTRDSSSARISRKHSLAIHLPGKDEACEEPCGPSSDTTPDEHSDTTGLTVEKNDAHLGNGETGREEVESVCHCPLQPPEVEGPGNEDVLVGNFTDLAYAQDAHLRPHIHDVGSTILPSELSQRLQNAENQVLVAETLYQLAAENLTKTRTIAKKFNPRGHKASCLEATASSVSIVTLPTSRIDTSTLDGQSPGTEQVRYALSPRVSRHIVPALPLKRIILSRESDLSQEVNALIRNEAEDDGVNALQTASLGVDYEAQSTEESSLALTGKAQRQWRQVSSSYYNNNKSSFRKGLQHRRQPCDVSSYCNFVGLRTFLATAAAFGFVVIALAMGSCDPCHKSDQCRHYIRPT